MARVTYGPMITNLQGSIGGVTFQSNRAGAIARLRPTNVKRRTPSQSTRISEFSQLATNWQSLSLADKILWNDYGIANPKITKFGTTKILTGYNYFISLNFWRNFLGLAVLTVPPPFVIPPPPVDFQYNLLIDQFQLESVNFPAGANFRFISYFTPPILNIGKTNFNKMRLLGTSLAPTMLPQNQTAGFNAFFGLDYLSLRDSGNWYMGIMIQTLDITSGLTSAGLFKTFGFS